MTTKNMTSRHGAGRTRLLVGILSLVVLLSACAGLPTGDTVEPGLPVQGAPIQEVQALPVGPEEDASPDQIVASFLLASGSFADDHEVARTFLTDDLARQWRPTSQVLVYDGEPELTVVDGSTVRAEVTVRGAVDEDGYLVEEPRGTAQTHQFTMEQVGGQWRISSFPDNYGVWLSETTFELRYGSYAIHYVTPDSGLLVPDIRWFPRGDGLPTSLATAQIGPVPDYLAGAASTGISEDLHLVASAVPVDPATGTATVELRGLSLGNSAVQQKELFAQFAQTLKQAPGVNSVLIRGAGRPLQVEGVDNPIADVAATGFEDAEWVIPYGLLRSRVDLIPVMPQHYQLQDNRAVDPESLPSIPIRWQDVATDAEVREFAGISTVGGDELWRWKGGTENTMGGIGTELTAPTFDRSGALWLAGRATTGPRVWVIARSEPLSRAVARPMEAPWLDENQTVTDFRVAADDQRALIVLQDRDTQETQVGITGIIRGKDGQPTALTEPYQVAPTLTSVTSAVWASQTELFVLGRQAQDTTDRPFRVHIGGWLEPLRLVSEATDVRAVPSDDSSALLVLSEQGRIYTQDRNDWGIGRNGDDLIIPGT
ncbi:LpqB family beta-propeller domain-containing protein [Ornithinimicrobium faecis]|uniref:LpqB family beta-propeller domain-containing protein n=1 Tax=Ornithinimicrobium faecis TaxID=2934158 RepID=A0ABY4YPL7_9MICO|nr:MULTISPECIES: LpqB family beta-propeller domain-containing protein [unclassified Ornithinimicrobium]USQ78718.1 LpqB family beta-propeller domain-containing protein [Ornithinimicrobium sp. HY1793]